MTEAPASDELVASFTHTANDTRPEINSYTQVSRPELAALLARLSAAEAERDGFRRNLRESFEANCAMRDSINDVVPMPSLESDLLQGPEPSVFCSTVAAAVVEAVGRLKAERDAAIARAERLEDALTPFTFCDPVMDKILWGEQSDDELVTLRIKFGYLRRARAALSEKDKANG